MILCYSDGAALLETGTFGADAGNSFHLRQSKQQHLGQCLFISYLFTKRVTTRKRSQICKFAFSIS